MAASRALGSLTIDLVARIGGFSKGMSEAERASDKATREIAKKNAARAREVRKAWDGIGNVIGAAFAGISAGAIFGKFITESINAQNEQAQLAAVLKSTGEAAGFSADQLNKMADSLAAKSVFGAGDINQAQTRLLSYTGIVGQEFPRALQAAIDMATRMGVEVSQAAETVGKALDSPKDGLAALSKQGFRFTEDQKALVEELQNTGKTAQAQDVILRALESAYGGAAQAARDTFGGSLLALREQLNDLMTGDDGSLKGATDSVNNLTRTLASPETKTAFGLFTSWLANAGATALTSAANLINFIGAKNKLDIVLGNDQFGQLSKNAEMFSDQLEQSTKRIEQLKIAADNEPNNPRRAAALKAEQERWKTLTKQRQDATDALKGFADPVKVPGIDPTGFAALDANGLKQPIDAAGAAARAKAREEAEKAAKRAGEAAAARAKQEMEAADRAVRALKEQLGLVGDLTEVQQLQARIEAGTVKFITDAQKKQAFEYARQLDVRKQALELFDEELKGYDKIIEAEKKATEERTKRLDALSGYDKVKEQIEDMELLNDAFERGELGLEDYRAAFNKLNEQSEVFGEKTVTAFNDIGEFTKEAARSIQNTLGDALYNIGETGFKGLAKGFADTLRKMASDALAAQLAKKLFGDFDKGGGLGGVFGGLFDSAKGAFNNAGGLSGIFGSIGSFFGRATGGFTAPGSMYQVNENGPELLSYGNKTMLMMGGQSGNVTPLSPMGGGSKAPIINNYGAQVDTYMSNDQLIIEIDKRIGKQGPKMVERQLSNPNSRGGKALSRNTTASWRRS